MTTYEQIETISALQALKNQIALAQARIAELERIIGGECDSINNNEQPDDRAAVSIQKALAIVDTMVAQSLSHGRLKNVPPMSSGRARENIVLRWCFIATARLAITEASSAQIANYVGGGDSSTIRYAYTQFGKTQSTKHLAGKEVEIARRFRAEFRGRKCEVGS